MKPRSLAVLTGLLAVACLGVLTWAVIDQRKTNDELVQAFEDQSAERRAGIEALLRRFDERSQKHRGQTKSDLRVIIRSLREVLRQLGGDPTQVPPSGPSGSNNPGRPNPDPPNNDPPGKPPKPDPPNPGPPDNPGPSDEVFDTLCQTAGVFCDEETP
jgi:hypothetical protein